jgi:hypothetical protein
MAVSQHADMPTWECFDLIGASTVGRLCFLDGDTPIAFPLSFKLHRADDVSYIVVRTGRTSLIAKHVGPASFEVDDIDLRSRSAWSVVLRGSLRASHTNDHLPVPDPWIVDGRHAWLLLEIASVSGRRFVASDAADGFSVEWQFEEMDLGPQA